MSVLSTVYSDIAFSWVINLTNCKTINKFITLIPVTDYPEDYSSLPINYNFHLALGTVSLYAVYLNVENLPPFGFNVSLINCYSYQHSYFWYLTFTVFTNEFQTYKTFCYHKFKKTFDIAIRYISSSFAILFVISVLIYKTRYICGAKELN